MRPCLGGRAPEHLFVQLGKLSAYGDLRVGGYRGDVFQCSMNPEDRIPDSLEGVPVQILPVDYIWIRERSWSPSFDIALGDPHRPFAYYVERKNRELIRQYPGCEIYMYRADLGKGPMTRVNSPRGLVKCARSICLGGRAPEHLFVRSLVSSRHTAICTNWHVVTGGFSQRLPFDPGMHETVKLHQPPVEGTADGVTSSKVGTLSDWRNLSPTGVNFVDAAEFEIAEDVAAAHIPCKPASLATQPNSSPSPDPPTPYTPCSSPLRTPGPLYRLLPSPTHLPTQDAQRLIATLRH